MTKRDWRGVPFPTLGRGRVTNRALDMRLRENRAERTTTMSNSRRVVRYIPVEEGASVDFGDSGLPGISGTHKFIGYQAAPIGPRTAAAGYKPHGWLVYLVNEDVSSGHPRRLRALRKAG